MSDPTNPSTRAQRTKGTRARAIKKVAMPRIAEHRTKLTENLKAEEVHWVANTTKAFHAHLAFQTRAQTEKNPTGLNASNVRNLRTVIGNGGELPPIVLARIQGSGRAEGKACFVVSGFHRVEAYRQAGAECIPVIIKDMTRKEALAYAAAENTKHGQPLSRQDKRTNLKAFLSSGGWKEADGSPKAYKAIALQGTGGAISKHTVRNWIKTDHPEIFKAIAAHWSSEEAEQADTGTLKGKKRDFEGEARGHLQALLGVVQSAYDAEGEGAAVAICHAAEEALKDAWGRIPDEFSKLETEPKWTERQGENPWID